MKRHALFVVLLCWFTLFFATTSYALTIPASEDSYTASGNKLNNLTNNANSLIVDATRKSYLYFDLSDIPTDAVVRWAKLRLFLPTVRTPGAGLSVHLVTGTWNESTRLADVPSIVAGSLAMIAPDKMASRRFVTVDVKDTVQKWINGGTLNEGFAIQPIVRAGSTTASVMLTSKEGSVFGLPAELDIEFDPIISAGPQGEKGQVGAIGPVGPRGEKGDTGAVGPQGMQGDIGMAGPQGIQGVAGRDGKTVLGGTIEPSSSIGNDGDFYINTTTSVLYGPKTDSEWGSGTSLVGPKGESGPAGPQGIQGAVGVAGPMGPRGETGAQGIQGAAGPKGETGATGSQGAPGVDGKTILNGTVAPPISIGSNGDFYINTTTSVLYGPRTASGWGSGTSLVGAQGPSVTGGGGQIAFEQLPTSVRSYFSPAITTQPAAYASSGSLKVLAVGFSFGDWSYKWTRDGVPLEGGTNADLPVAGLPSGIYSVIVNNGFAETKSEPVLINQQSESPIPVGFVFLNGGTLPTSSVVGYAAVDDFHLSQTEVTWKEWQAVRSWAIGNGYTDLSNVGAGLGDNYPATGMDWYAALKWCNAKSEKEGRTPVYTVNGAVYRTGFFFPAPERYPNYLFHIRISANGYRLPTEAEWQFAANGGLQTGGYIYSGSDDLDAVAWHLGNSANTVKEVGKKLANELGIFDMSGNVWEWVFTGNPNGTSGRMIRGGGVYDGNCALNYRVSSYPAPNLSRQDLGFRLAISSPASGFSLVPGGEIWTQSPLETLKVSTFCIGRTEVTWKEWQAVRSWANGNGYDIGSVADEGSIKGDHYPVGVDWHNTLKWCNAKSEKEGRTPVYTVNGAVYRTGTSIPNTNLSVNGYRLPTEAEWEFAARGGASTQRYTYSGSNYLNSVGWYDHNSSPFEITAKEVGQLMANELLIYDMSGNVAEWCFDVWDAFSTSRVGRGGHSYLPSEYCSVSKRLKIETDTSYKLFGFRVAFTAL